MSGATTIIAGSSPEEILVSSAPSRSAAPNQSEAYPGEPGISYTIG